MLEGLQDGVHVYFQPPPNIQMEYPAIVYNRDYDNSVYADNSVYSRKIRYMLTVIDPDPDSSLPDVISSLPLTKFVRHYTTAGLNHDIINMYF
jgi:hypothetical protein